MHGVHSSQSVDAVERSVPSVLRLVNLALGVAGAMALPGGFKWLTDLVQTHWLLPGVWAELAPITIAFTSLAITLGLPASMLLLLFLAAGLHRRLHAPRKRANTIGLTVAWIVYVVWIFAAYLLLAEQYTKAGDGAGAVAMLVGIGVAPFFIAAILWGLVSAWREIGVLLRVHPGEHDPWRKVLPWIVALPLALAVPLILDSTRPFSRSAAATSEFDRLCKDVGVRLLAKPSGPVRSMAYDWDPQRLEFGRPDFDRYELDSNGRIGTMGGFAGTRSSERDKKLDFDFTESRTPTGRSGAATINPQAPIYRFPAFRLGQPYYGVDSFSADVLLYIDVDRPEELRKARPNQSAVRYELTLTDRRSGAVLGTFSYVVDQVNLRGCGANVDGNISQDAFIYDAIHR